MARGNPEIQKLLSKFSKLFMEATGDFYLPTRGRDERIFLDILSYLPPPEVEKLLELYFKEERGVFSLPFFRCQLNELRQKVKRDSKPEKTLLKDAYD